MSAAGAWFWMCTKASLIQCTYIYFLLVQD